MILTLDVSAAIEVVMGRPKQGEITDLLRKADWIIAPSLFTYETSNVMWKYSNTYDVDILIKKTRQTLALVDEYIGPETIYEEAIAMSCKNNHPAYDAMYLVSCRRRNATLVTLDNKLMNLASTLQIPYAMINKS